jgi:ubiquinone biosynthesis accessory factor UbiJ
MFEALAVPAINRLLRSNTWALDQLKPHVGKTALLTSAPLEIRLSVSESGEVLAAVPDAGPDVTIEVSPGLLLRMLARDESAWSAARVTGDMEFAGAIDHLRRNLVWDYEEDLSHLLGDIGAHRVASAVRELDRWGRAAVQNLGHAFAEYSIYEQPMLASARAVDQFLSDVDELRDDAARLEKRIELLERGLSTREP